jgi:hypothetical protein
MSDVYHEYVDGFKGLKEFTPPVEEQSNRC